MAGEMKNMKDEETEKEKQNETSEPSKSEADNLDNLPDSSVKPRYGKLVDLVIESAVLKKFDEPKEDSNDEKYYSHKVVIKYSDKSSEGFGGLRVYPDRIWYSGKSAYGEVKTMLEEHLKLDKKLNPNDFVKKLIGMKVKVKSRNWEVGDQKGYKNIPVEFSD